MRAHWRQDRFGQPCAVDQRALLEVDGHLFAAAAAAAFEAIELSPLAPLDVCSFRRQKLRFSAGAALGYGRPRRVPSIASWLPMALW